MSTDGIIPIDLTQVGLKPGPFVGVVSKIKFQTRKSGEKWNKEGIEEVDDVGTLMAYPATLPNANGEDKAARRIQVTFKFPELNSQAQNHHFYLVESAYTFIKDFQTAAQIPINSVGINPANWQNANVGCNLVCEDSDNGPQFSIGSFYKA